MFIQWQLTPLSIALANVSNVALAVVLGAGTALLSRWCRDRREEGGVRGRRRGTFRNDRRSSFARS